MVLWISDMRNEDAITTRRSPGGAAPTGCPGGGRWHAQAEAQQQEVIALVRETTPDALGLAGFLWTRDAVAELIARRHWGAAGAHHGGPLSARLAVQPTEAGCGAPLAGRGVLRRPRPGQVGGRSGVVAG